MQDVLVNPVEVSQAIQPTQEKRLPKPIEANESGQLIGSTLEDQFRLAKAYFSSGLMPKALNSPEKVLVAMQLCRELSLPPMTSIGKICVISGTPSLFGDLPLALVMRSGLLLSIEETWIHDPGTHKVVGAKCKVKRKGIEGETERVFTLDDAKQAGLLGKGPWQAYTSRMLQMRSRSWALKDLFADVLSGCAVLEYDFNATVDDHGNVVGVESPSVADELNKKYASEEKTDQEQGSAQ